MEHGKDGYWWENYLTLEEWARVPASQQMWYRPDAMEDPEERLQVTHEMGLVVQGFILSSLTLRQRQVVELYCLEGLTQVEVAKTLGISQASVSQHLHGKLRNKQHVGGAFRKLRKSIRKAAHRRSDEDTRHAKILAAFNELLSEATTRRRASEITGSLMRSGREGG